MRSSHLAAQSGFTLVESIVCLAVISLTLGLAVPSMDHLRSRVQLRNFAAQLETDLQWARSTAVALNRRVQVSFDKSGAGSCYVVHTGHTDDCTCDGTGASTCSPGADALRTVYLASGDGLSMSSNSRYIGFEPIHGIVTPTATIAARSRHSEQINIVINIMGRVRHCSATPSLSGSPPCR